MRELLNVVTAALGSDSCTKILKISEGQHNKVFQLTMDDGREVIAKLPNPNAGRQHFTTASEVATMDFVYLLSSFPLSAYYHTLRLTLVDEKSPPFSNSESLCLEL